jgi:hypothetical protein
MATTAVKSGEEHKAVDQQVQPVAAQEQQPPAPPNALNKYVELLPTTDHQWWAGAYNAAATAIFVAFLVAAVATVIFVGITEPGYLPIAMIGVPMFLPQVNGYIAGFRQKALTETAFDQVERGIAQRLERIPNTEEGVQAALEAINIPEKQIEQLRQRLGNLTRMRPLIARYQHWEAVYKGTLHAADQMLTNAARAPNPLKTKAMEFESLKLEDRALIEKTYAAYFRGVMLNLFAGDVDQVFTFTLMPMEERIMQKALADRYDTVRYTHEHERFLNYPDKTPFLSWEKVELVTIEELSIELFKPKPVAPPEVKPKPLVYKPVVSSLQDAPPPRRRITPDMDEKTRYGIEHGILD